MKNKCKKIIGIILTFIILFNVRGVFSATQSEINNKIKENQKKQEEVKAEKADKLEKVEQISWQINEYEKQITQLNNQIDEANRKIEEAEQKLKQKQEEYEVQKKMLEDRMVAVYEAGETSYLDFILSSQSLADFISNYYLVSEITNYDTELLEKIQKQKEEIQKAKEDIETGKKELTSAKSTKEGVSTQLKSTKKEYDAQVAQLSEEEKKLQKEMQVFQAEKNRIEEELRRQAQKYKDKVSVTPSKSGYINPIPGVGKGSITCGINGYSGHTGVDYGGYYGSAVVAVKSGVVITSKDTSGGIAWYNSNGEYAASYSSYGVHIIIDHEDGTFTLYAHGLPGSRLVSVGQRVSQGQQIMTVGNTGNVLPRPSAYSPRNGAHLHFEVRVNGVAVNPVPYLP